MAKSCVIGTDELMRKFKALDEAVQEEALAFAVLEGAKVITDEARANIQKQGLIKTRTLSRSISEAIEERSATRAVVAIGTNLEYAAIHEYGGTIRPKNGKYLAIPVGTYKGSPTTHADLKVVKTRSGSLVMLDDNGTVQYVLKPSVTIPARPYLRPALDDKKEEARQRIGESLKRLIEKAAGS